MGNDTYFVARGYGAPRGLSLCQAHPFRIAKAPRGLSLYQAHPFRIAERKADGEKLGTTPTPRFCQAGRSLESIPGRDKFWLLLLATHHYELDENLKPIPQADAIAPLTGRYLGNQTDIRARIDGVKNQTK